MLYSRVGILVSAGVGWRGRYFREDERVFRATLHGGERRLTSRECKIAVPRAADGCRAINRLIRPGPGARALRARIIIRESAASASSLRLPSYISDVSAGEVVLACTGEPIFHGAIRAESARISPGFFPDQLGTRAVLPFKVCLSFARFSGQRCLNLINAPGECLQTQRAPIQNAPACNCSSEKKTIALYCHTRHAGNGKRGR